MLLKELVYALRQHIAEITGEKPSSGHTYELLSALLGYDSFASLNSQAFIVSLAGCDGNSVENVRLLLGGIPDIRRATERHVSLKSPGSPRPIAQLVETFAQRHELIAIPLASLVELYEAQSSMDHATEYALEDLHSCFLDMEPQQLRLPLAMLEAHSAREPSVHYVLYRIYDRLVHHHDSGSDHWLRQLRAGRSLSSAEQQFAEEALFAESLKECRQLHLSRASSAGHAEAKLVELEGLRSRSGPTSADLAFFEPHASTPGFAWRVAALAEKAGMSVLAQSWLRRAASNGDVEALERLVSANSSNPTVETWIWIYLSRLLGSDVTASNLRAYHAGGQYEGEEFDDDQGGDFYVDGYEGLEVAPLSADLDSEAQAAAGSMYERIRSALPKN